MTRAPDAAARAVILAEGVAAARRAWPRLADVDAAFAAHLDRHLPREADAVVAQSWHVADLYLAFASARGDRVALAEFDASYMSRVPAMLSRLRQTDATIDDVRQLVGEKLFVARGEAEPKILGYSGQAPLASWLRVVATRTALGVLRKKAPARADEEALDDLVGSADGELEYVRTRYRADFDRAFGDAFGALEPRARNVLRLHVVDAVGIDGVGTAYGVHRATAARWIAAARTQLLDETRRLLVERLRLAPGELDSLVRVMKSGLDVSLRGLVTE